MSMIALHLNRDVQCTRRFVRDDEVWLRAQRQGDHDTLPHTAGELVWILRKPLSRLGYPHIVQQLRRSPARVAGRQPQMDTNCFGELVADGEQRIEAGQWILKHHANPAASYAPPLIFGTPVDANAVQPDLPFGHAQR
jgi:hypothetical protein